MRRYFGQGMGGSGGGGQGGGDGTLQNIISSSCTLSHSSTYSQSKSSPDIEKEQLGAMVLKPVSFEQLIKDRETDDGTDDGVEKVSSPTTSSFKIGSDQLDWIEPSMKLCNSTSTLQVPSSDQVYEAFHLLKTEASVQRMVMSLSSDKAVWNAIMNNDAVREIREAVTEGIQMLKQFVLSFLFRAK
nr:hypothetical protein [Tanacetum cinerariifolium]